MDATNSAGSFEGRLAFASGRQGIDQAQRCIIEGAERLGYGHAACFSIRLALEEALTNAVQHGNLNDPAKQVRVVYQIDPAMVRIEIQDQGGGFDPGAVPDPTRPENLAIPAGRGILLMQSCMSEVVFDPPGQRVRMTDHRQSAHESDE